MSALSILRTWRRTVHEQLLPETHGHTAKALADLSFGMTLARHCHSGRVATAIPGDAQPASAQRRWERTLANERIEPGEVLHQVASHWLRAWRGRTLLLILDETPQRGTPLGCMKLSAAYKKRAIPVAGVCYPHDSPPVPMPELIAGLLREAALDVPEGTEVTVLLDRGLTWPETLDVCTELGWHFVARIQGSTRVRDEDRREQAAEELVPRPGRRWFGRGDVFKKAGWRSCSITAVWDRGCAEPWLLVSDRPCGEQRCRTYAKRFWTEESFRDEKGQGFHWEKSHVKDPVHAMRLLLLLTLATVLALSLGTAGLKAGQRRQLEARRDRQLSVFQLGLRLLTDAVTHDRFIECRLCLHPG
jgi:hypothetical protein